MHIVIIGAGISGLLSAYYLLQRGHKVDILESAPIVASQASGANAAQLSYTYVNPIASPSLLNILPSVFLGRNDGFKIHQYDIRMLLWGIKLLGQTLPSRFNSNRSQLLSLSLHSRELFDALKHDTGIIFKNHSHGKIQLFHTQTLKESAQEFMEELRQQNIHQKWLDQLDCQHYLHDFLLDNDFTGAVYSDIDETADCPAFCGDLLEHLNNHPDFSIHFDTPLNAWDTENKHITAIRSHNDKCYKADCFLLCTGSYTNEAVKPLGLSFPIYPIKGYTLVYPYDSGLTCSVTDHKNKMVFVPYNKQLLVSGMFHFDGNNTTIHNETIKHMHLAAQSRIPALKEQSFDVRCGLRPCTPSSIPIIEATSYPNLYINSGQGMYGWTLSTASAYKAAELVDRHQ